jgi:ribonuclease P protein component
MAADRKRGRLSRSGDFDRVYREGRSHSNRYFVLYAFPRAEGDAEAGDEEQDSVRLGLSVSRKVGGAVERNAVKRAIREAFWALSDGLPSEFDFVIVARQDSAALVDRDGTSGVESALKDLFAEAGLDGPSPSGGPHNQERRNT